MLTKIKIFVQCKLFGLHDWTCAREQGIPATQDQISGGVQGFTNYAKLYCKDCGTISRLSQRQIDDVFKR